MPRRQFLSVNVVTGIRRCQPQKVRGDLHFRWTSARPRRLR
jgi:hypothetical protein